jgi:hypothetical protein
VVQIKPTVRNLVNGAGFNVQPAPEIAYLSFDMFVVMVMFLSRLILIPKVFTLVDVLTALILDTFVVMVMFLTWPTLIPKVKDETQLFSPYLGEFVIRGFTYIFVQKQKFAPRRLVQAPYYVHKRGLAAAGRAHEGYELAMLNVQVYSL